MSEMIGQKFIFNNELFDSSEFNNLYKDIAPSVYEVVRIMNGIPLFFEEHYERLLHSAKLLNHKLSLSIEDMKNEISKLARINNMKDNNIKIVINNLNMNGYNEYYFLVKSSYPSPELYSSGVNTMTYHATRKNPNAKVIYQEMRDTINRQLKETGNYEALLINDKNEVTEGSRSNLFFLKENVLDATEHTPDSSAGTLYTAPATDVLIGITRQKLIKLCKENNINVMEVPIPIESITEFDSCFLSGTSPKVLPIHKVDNHCYSLQSPLLNKILALYDQEIHQYLDSHKSKDVSETVQD